MKFSEFQKKYRFHDCPKGKLILTVDVCDDGQWSVPA